MDRGGLETAGLGGPLRVFSETLGAPRDVRVASWLDGGVRIGTYPALKRARERCRVGVCPSLTSGMEH